MAVVRFRPSLSFAEAKALLGAVLTSGSDRVAEFERRFSDEMLDGRRLLLAPSGRVALYWILRGLHLAPGDEVVTQAFNFAAVPAAIQAAGAVPRFADLEPDGFNLDPMALRQVLSARTRAVVVTHLYGNPARLDAFLEICRAEGIVLIEDCGQAVGATHHGRPVGIFGKAALFTFGPTKNFTLMGGGAVATSDAALSRSLEELASQHPRLGLGRTLKMATMASGLSLFTSPLSFNLAVHPGLRLLEAIGVDPVHRLMDEPAVPLTHPERSAVPSDLMAAVGLAQLDRIQEMNQKRIKNGWLLYESLRHLSGIRVPVAAEGNLFMSFPVFHTKRKAFATELRRRGVDTDLGFMADCSALSLFGGPSGDFPHSQRAEAEIIHLPVHPELDRRDLERIVRAVEEAVKVLR